MEHDDRREFSRVSFHTNVTIRTPDRTIWSSSSIDISLSGIRISSAEALPAEGARCEVEIVLTESPSPEIIEMRGTIVRSGGGTMAVHVTEVDLDSYQHLRRLILSNAGDPARAEREIDDHWGIRQPASPSR